MGKLILYYFHDPHLKSFFYIQYFGIKFLKTFADIIKRRNDMIVHLNLFTLI